MHFLVSICVGLSCVAGCQCTQSGCSAAVQCCSAAVCSPQLQQARVVSSTWWSLVTLLVTCERSIPSTTPRGHTTKVLS